MTTLVIPIRHPQPSRASSQERIPSNAMLGRICEKNAAIVTITIMAPCGARHSVSVISFTTARQRIPISGISSITRRVARLSQRRSIMPMPENTAAASICRDKYQKQAAVTRILATAIAILSPPPCVEAGVAATAAMSVIQAPVNNDESSAVHC
jgi:hypothetical protein